MRDAVFKLLTIEYNGSRVAGGGVTAPLNCILDGIKGPRFSGSRRETRGCKGLKKWRLQVIRQRRRRCNGMKLTAFDEGVDVRGRIHGVTRDVCKISDGVRACRGRDEEGTGI